MLAHISVDSVIVGAFCYPLQRYAQIVLPQHITLYIGAPFLNVGILAIAKFFFRLCNKRTRIDGIWNFLMVQRYACNVNGFEPCLDFGFFALTNVNRQRCFIYFLFLIIRHCRKIVRHTVIINQGEFSSQKAPQTCDTLLPVQNFVFICTHFIEVKQS